MFLNGQILRTVQITTPNLKDYMQKPTCVDESRLVEKPSNLTPYYSSSLHVLRIYALRVTLNKAYFKQCFAYELLAQTGQRITLTSMLIRSI